MTGDQFPGSTVRHGTPSGFSRHHEQGTDPCNACRNAKATYDRNWRLGSEQTRKNRLRARAQSLALAALRRLHPAEYDALYEEKISEVFGEAGIEPPRRKRRG